MKVVFERVDARRYLIGVVRDGRYDVGPDVPVRPAPGHADVPHDLVHFAVEEQLGLRLGIYGQIAAGGDVGGFFVPAPADRHPAGDKRRSDRLGRAGRVDAARSELVAGLAHTGRLQRTAGVLTVRERTAVDRRLVELLTAWESTAPGGRLVLTWTDHLTLRRGVLPQDLSRRVTAGR